MVQMVHLVIVDFLDAVVILGQVFLVTQESVDTQVQVFQGGLVIVVFQVGLEKMGHQFLLKDQ